MSIHYKILLKEEEKEKIQDKFFVFFNSVYKKKLTSIEWTHQFLNSPYNDSPLFIAFNNDKIVVSALMIKQKIKVHDKIFSYYLFTTSAILEAYRVKGIYAELLKLQKEYALKNKSDFIFAFPNKLALPVLKLFGGFKPLEKINLVETFFHNIDFKKSNNTFILDKNSLKWRFEHKEYGFFKINKNVCVYKYFNSKIDILEIYDERSFPVDVENELNFQKHDKFIIPEFYVKDLSKNIKYDSIFPTYYAFNKEVNYNNIKPSLLMSDVF